MGMGYNSQIKGGLEIIPPLNTNELADEPFASSNAASHGHPLFVILEEASTSPITDDSGNPGVAIFNSGTTVVFARTGVETSCYTWDDDLRALLSRHPDHEFHGELVRVGAENGDVERCVATGHELRYERATLVWGDGSKVAIPD